MSTQQRILRAAESLFAHQGYDSTTIDQVARAAGLTKGAVYYFFKNKAELFCMMVDRGVSYIEEQCARLLEARRSSREIAQDVIAFYVNIAYGNANIFRILFGSQSADPVIRELFDQRIRRLLGCFREIVQSGIDDGLLRPVDPEIFTRMFVGVIYGLLALPDVPEREEAAKALKLLLETGIFAAEGERRR